MPLTLAYGSDENVNCWGVGILTSPDHSAKHVKGYSKAPAVNWVQCGACNPGRARWYRWLEFSSERSLSEVRNCCEGILSFRNFLVSICSCSSSSVSVLAYGQFCISSLHANAVSSLTIEPELLFPKFCPNLAPAQPKWCGCYCSGWLHWKHRSQIRLRADLAKD